MEVFEECHTINAMLLENREDDARSRVILLLDHLETTNQETTPLINSLVRQVGLFPYINAETADWQDRLVCEAFKVNAGEVVDVTLHREQSRLLKDLLEGKSIAVSAPTSFGKSFVIDSFISIRKPRTVVIIVPTIALTDETRRRLTRKFGREYKIITAPEQQLAEKSILIFPQERSVGYAQSLQSIDILIVDEFYKASAVFDPERSPSLIRAIIDLGKIASQKYFLAPNIDEIRQNPFTEGMEFLRLPFHTVVLKTTDLSASTQKDEEAKSAALIKILGDDPGKTLIYAGTYSNVRRIETLLISSLRTQERPLLDSFQRWLAVNYDPNWPLAKLAVRGVGIHYGRLHRSLGQIQIKLFEDEQGLDTIVSTSSIIEGVNTSAQTVVLWSNRNGRVKINDFTYKNIIGRGGRMFRHFVGNIFILDSPPDGSRTQLELDFPEDLLGIVDENNSDIEFSPEQAAAIEQYRREMISIVGTENFDFFRNEGVLQSASSSFVLRVAKEIVDNRNSWNGLAVLNSDDPDKWKYFLFKLIRLLPASWGTDYTRFVTFVQILSLNWKLTIPELLRLLEPFDMGLDIFFELERNVSFKLAAVLADVQAIYRRMHSNVDIQPAISRLTNAFLPPAVHQLEEYGLPRMISRKIHRSGIIDFETPREDIVVVLDELRSIGESRIVSSCNELDNFDKYILNYFFNGIELQP